MLPLLRVFGFLAALSFLSACTSVETLNPIGVSNGATTDTRLIGAWKVVIEGGKSVEGDAYVFVLPDKRGGLEAVGVQLKKPASTDENGWETFQLITGKAGNYTFLNVRGILEDGVPVAADGQPKDGGYWPFLYRVEADGSVQLFLWESADVIKEAIMSGRISGSLSGETVRVSSDQASLDEFFSEAGARAFPAHFITLTPISR